MKRIGYSLLGLGFYSRKEEASLAWRIANSGPPGIRVRSSGTTILPLLALQQSPHFKRLLAKAKALLARSKK